MIGKNNLENNDKLIVGLFCIVCVCCDLLHFPTTKNIPLTLNPNSLPTNITSCANALNAEWP